MKEIINVTELSGYLFCPRKIYLKRVKKIKEPPTKPMMLGFLKHKIFDIFNKNQPAIVSEIKENLSEEQIIALFKINLEKITKEIMQNYERMVKGFKINPEELKEQTLEQIKKELELRADSIKKFIYLGFLGKDLWRNLKPKFLTEFEVVSEELGLKGRVDRIKIHDNIVPYEIKTREQIYDNDKIQLAAYSMLLEKEFGKKIPSGIIHTKTNEEKIEITEELKNQVLKLADKIRNMAEESEPKIQENFNKCKSCRIRKECFEL